MPDDVFRIVITVAVILACLAFVVQAIAALALYRVARALQQKFSPLLEKGEAVVGKASPVIDRVGPLLDQARPVIEKIGPLLDQASPVIQRAGATVDKATEVLTTTHKILEETRPRVAEITTEVTAIAKTGRAKIDKLGELLQDASER